MAEDLDISDRADFGVLVSFGHFVSGPVIAIAEVLAMGAVLVRHLASVARRIGGEEAGPVFFGSSAIDMAPLRSFSDSPFLCKQRGTQKVVRMPCK